MRRIRIISTIVGTLALAAASLAAAAPAQAAEIAIPDANLKSCINERLGQQPNDPITDAQAQSITSMSCFQRGISSLEGISALSNLEWFEVGVNNISDTAPLSGLGKLNDLFMNSNRISDLTPLASLKTLTQLQVSGNQISDVTPISVLSNLKFLSLASNQITNLAPLAQLTQLDTLWLHQNKISDVAPVAGLPLLQRLLLTGNAISDVSSLGPMANRIANAPDQYLTVTDQTVSLENILTDVSQSNPLRGFNGEVIAPAPGAVPVTFAANGESWTYSAPGYSVMSFTRAKTHDAAVTFSGRIGQSVLPARPTLKNDFATTRLETPVTVDVLANDGAPGESPLVPSTLEVLDADEYPIDVLVTPQGSYQVVDGKVLFTPAKGFTGTAPAVLYQVFNEIGGFSNASLTVTVTAEDPGTPVDPTPGTGLPGTGAPAPAERLANTGTGAEPFLGLAGLLLLGGGALAAASRLRRKPRRSR
ncbi:leucine-rich repeat domain-containing protein [Arthrobacter russicus]|uniref:CshA domain-containing protein n=1 Tax=Arthrobacter russicus TaxID=172040 RepID=A0ABU1J9V6_9MICC|nr:leucine-rich repeat domain-containing protein [Arthrobacter russicus]MDR6269213.1 hypothetical protein [Arthrobacter russicus]